MRETTTRRRANPNVDAGRPREFEVGAPPFPAIPQGVCASESDWLVTKPGNASNLPSTTSLGDVQRMRFSEYFDVENSDDVEWFDPHLTVDTRLFIDPLLMVDQGGQWAEAHEELLQHFVHCYRLVAKATSPTSVSGNTVRRLLTFPEPFEFGLGYTAAGTSGSGGGGFYASRIADGIAVAIALGLEQPEHIEEIGIFNERVGADLISDALANVLKARFVKYTQKVCADLAITTQIHRLRNSRVNLQHGRWLADDVSLPTNPKTGRPILLCPKALLNRLPTLNPEDWYSDVANEDLRGQLNLNIGERVSKSDIVQLARQNASRVREWAREQQSRDDLAGYDFADDRLGVVKWDREPVAFASSNPIEHLMNPETEEQLVHLVERILEQFKHYIEEQRGWSLLFSNDGSEKPEEAAQLVFLGMTQHYLRLFGVELDREVELGRGPVDFKVSAGAKIKLLIEIKKTHNGKFWNGLESQLPSYMKSDQCNNGWFVAIRYRDAKTSEKRMLELPSAVTRCAVKTGKNLRFSAIDARPKESASKL